MAEEPTEPTGAAQATGDPIFGSGKFYFPNDATYEGEWKCIPEPEAPRDGEGAEEGADAGEAEKAEVDAGGEEGAEGAGADADADAAKEEDEPKGTYLRHGKGKYVEGDYAYDGEWVDVRATRASARPAAPRCGRSPPPPRGRVPDR